MSLGVWSSMKPSSIQCWRIACSMVVCTRKISCASGRRRSRKRQSRRLSIDESSAIGLSFATDSTVSDRTLTSRPPSLTRSSALRSPSTVMNEPCMRLEIVAAVSAVSSFTGFTSWAEPDSSRRITNCTRF